MALLPLRMRITRRGIYGSPACQPPIGRLFIGPRQARVREIPRFAHVSLHMRENLFIRRKQTRVKYFPSATFPPLSLIDTCKNVWHVYARADTRSRRLFLESSHARKSEIVEIT